MVSYGWCRTAYVAAKCLAEAGHDVYVCDPSPLSMTRVSRYVKGFHRVPAFYRAPEDFVDALAALVGRWKIDLLMPMHEEAVTIQRLRRRLPSQLIVAAPELGQLTLGLDKYKIITVASSVGVDVPATYAPASLDDAVEMMLSLRYPLVIKTRHGNGGKGVVITRTQAECMHAYTGLVKRFGLGYENLPLLQEFVEGDLCGGAFLSVEGRVKACFCERYIRCKDNGFGTSVLRERMDGETGIREATVRVCSALGWTGVGHFDFIRRRKGGAPVLIEMNPRFWGALSLSVANGLNFPLALLHLHTGGNPDKALLAAAGERKRSLWIAGEIMACVNEVANKDWRAPMRSLERILTIRSNGVFDDFEMRDPLPLIFELLYYGAGFVRARGNRNPVESWMCQ